MFTIDGIEWPYPCQVNRGAEVRSSEISGEMMDGSFFNDVPGTYMHYSLRLVIPLTDIDIGNQIYELLTEPVDGHQFVLPYNGSTIEITARLEGRVNDVYIRLSDGRQYWNGLQFAVIANHPSKSMTLNGVIARGRTPLPDAVNPQVGDTYTWTGVIWDDLPDADSKSY